MSLINNDIPGVYSDFDTVGVSTGRDGAKTVGLAARASTGEKTKPVFLTGLSQARNEFGADAGGAKMIALVTELFANGAQSIIAIAVQTGSTLPANADYEAAFEALSSDNRVKITVCDTTDGDILALMKESTEKASLQKLERICVCGLPDENVQGATERALALNSPRAILTAGRFKDDEGNALDGSYSAAALAGIIACSPDPARPFNGAALKRSRLYARIDENAQSALIRAGVTPFDFEHDGAFVVRAVTTKTKTGGAADFSWRDITIVLIVDDVVATVRDALRARFKRAKNTQQTREAVASQIVVELEVKKTAQIINRYNPPRVSQSPDDPTVTVAEFDFYVVHGLNRIHLTAHILI